MQKLVAGAFSAEHQVSNALQELLSMEDISHGCLEIFAPQVRGLIGISDNREIVAAQISPDGPIGIKALKVLLRVRSGRYAFREGHRISSGGEFNVTAEDLQLLTRSVKGATTSEIPMDQAAVAPSAPAPTTVIKEPEATQSDNQRSKKGQSALDRMKATVASKTALRLQAVDAQELDGASKSGQDFAAERPQEVPEESVNSLPETTDQVDSGEPWIKFHDDRPSPPDFDVKAEFAVAATSEPQTLEGESHAAVLERSEPATPNVNKKGPQKKSWAAQQLSNMAAMTRAGLKGYNLQFFGSQDGGGSAAKVLESTEAESEQHDPYEEQTGARADESYYARERATVEQSLPSESGIENLDGDVRGGFSRDPSVEHPQGTALMPDGEGRAAEPDGKYDSSMDASYNQTSYDQSSYDHTSYKDISLAEFLPPPQQTGIQGKLKRPANVSNPRLTSTLLQALKPNTDSDLQAVKRVRSLVEAKDPNAPRRTKSIELESTRANERRRKKRVKRQLKAALALAAASCALGAIYLSWLACDEAVQVQKLKTLSAKEKPSQEEGKRLASLAYAALQWHPNSSKLHYYRGIGLRRSGQYEKALEDFVTGLNLNPNDTYLRNDKAYTELLLGKYQDSINDYTNLLSNKSNPPAEALAKRAYAYMSLGNFERARQDLLDVRKTSYNQPDVDKKAITLNLAACEAQLKNFAKSKELVKEILTLYPNDPDVYTKLGFVLLKAHEFPQAKQALLKSLSIKPTPEAHLQLSELYREKGDLKAVVNEYTEYLALKPKDSPILLARAHTLIDMGKVNEALNDYNDAAATKQIGNNLSFYSGRADLERRLGKFDLAAADYEKAKDSNPNSRSVKLNLADCNEKAGHNLRAIDIYTSLLSEKPNDAQILIKRGKDYMLVRDFASGNADFEKAVSVGGPSTQTEAYFLRGMSCFKQELYDKADVDFNNVLRLNPHHEEAKKMKAQIASLMRTPKATGELTADTKTIEPGENLSTSELINKGYALMTAGQPDVAIKFFAKAIKREPYNRDARRYIAYALLAAQNAPAAIDQFVNLERIGPLNADERSKYVEALRVAGRSNRAITVLQRYLLSHPDDVSVRCDLAKLFASLDMLAEFQETCMEGMQVAKTAGEWDVYHSLLRDTMKKAPDRSEHSDQIKEKLGG